MYMYVNKRVELAQRGIALYNFLGIIIVLFEGCTRHSLVDTVVVITAPVQPGLGQPRTRDLPVKSRHVSCTCNCSFRADCPDKWDLIHMCISVCSLQSSGVLWFKVSRFYLAFGPWGLEREVTFSHDIPYEQVHELHESGGGRPGLPVRHSL